VTDEWDWQSDIARFIAARLDEDEARARAVECDQLFDGTGIIVMQTHLDTHTRSVTLPSHVADYTVRFDPARVLAEIAVKRVILEAHDGEHYCMPAPDGRDYWNHNAGWAEAKDHPQTCPVHRMYAAIYKDHPDYRQEWTP
jgi:hypothetical protein